MPLPTGLQTTIDGIRGLPWDTLIRNLSGEMPAVLMLVQAVAYVLALFFVISGLMMAAKSANPQARADHGSMAWLWSLTIGALMLALPTTIASVAVSLFGTAGTNPNPLAYVGQPTGAGRLAPLVPLLQVIGVIAVIRGLVVFRAVGMYGNYSKGNATFSRGLVLVISGVLLVHMQNMLGLVSSLTGLNVGAGLF